MIVKLEYVKEGLEPNFTFIIPTYNRFNLLIRSIESILKLNVIFNYEIIIVDNNSQETAKLNTLNFLKKIKLEKHVSIKYYYYLKNTGMYENWNNGIKHCKTKYFTILNDDDVLLSGFNKLIKFTLKSQPDEAICGTILYWDGKSILNFKNNNSIKKIIFFILSFTNFNIRYNLDRGFNGNPIPGTLGGILNKNIIEKIGFYDKNFGLAADYDFNIRCLSTIGVKRFYTLVALYYVNNNTSSTIETTRKFLFESKIIRFKILKILKFKKISLLNMLKIKQSIFLYEHVKMFNFNDDDYNSLLMEYNLHKLYSFNYYFYRISLFIRLLLKKIHL